MRSPKFTYIVFSIIGLGMLTGSFFLIQNTLGFLKEAISAQGKVIDLIQHESDDHDYTYAPKIQFTTKDNQHIEFTSNLFSNPPGYSVGQKVEILYSRNNPNKAEINQWFSLWFGPGILTFLGLVFSLIGALALISNVKRAQTIKFLRNSGRKIETTIIDIEQKQYRVNGRYPYSIISQYQEGNQITTFKSDNIWFDPADLIKDKKITVYVDPGNFNKYYMDISSLMADNQNGSIIGVNL